MDCSYYCTFQRTVLNKHYRNIGFLALFSLLFAVGCSTEKDAWLNRTYHNTTAHYNGYFNAGEIIKEAMDQYALARQENYDEIIPIFEYADEEGSKSLYSPMDTAAKKCEIVIDKNSMPHNKKGQYRKTEWCKWIDDNWLVIGQSQFYKRKFEDALKTFEFIEKQYDKESISYTARLWQAKAHIESENYDEALEILEKLETDQTDLVELKEEAKEEAKELKEKKKKRKKSSSRNRGRKPSRPSSSKKPEDKLPPEFPKNFERDLSVVKADLFLRQKEYKDAIEMLEKSIDLVKKRQLKTRLTFILAQVHHEQGNQQASVLYQKVVKMNPEYDMAFRAKINMALAFSGSDSRNIKALLLKMLKDDKNAEYLDQIYYALADIELRQNNRTKGIEYLELSVLNSVSDDKQKSKSFLRLGKLYYSERNYVKAQQYYDSTMSTLPKDHEEYETIQLQNESLTELVQNLNVITKQDSLLHLCDLSEKERMKVISQIIEDKKLEIERKKEEEENMNLNLPQNGNITSGPSSGKFWVWDSNLRGIGFNDFKKMWGGRKLEDNWRRSNKNSSITEDDGSPESDSATNGELTPEYYLKDLPCGDEAKVTSARDDIMNALYEAGTIYRVKLNDNNAAKETFGRLVNDFLPEEKAVAGLYQMYLLHSGAEQMGYKHQILDDYPNSEYAKLINDPNYKEKEQSAKDQASKDYKVTYSQFELMRYDKVIQDCDKVIKNDTANAFLCKYYYLKSLAIGNKYRGEKNEHLENALADVVKHCKGDPVHDQAKAILDKLRNVQSVQNAKDGNSTYIYAPDMKHFFVLVFPNNKGSVNQTKSKISNFNKASFSSQGIKISSSFLDTENQLVLVKSFPNKAAAMDYYVAFKVNKKQVKAINQDFTYFVITNKNYASFYIEKNVQEYLDFFDKNYLE